MSRVSVDTVKKKATELLGSGTVDRVLGYKKGEFDYDQTPHIFRSAEEIESSMLYDTFSSPNFSKYLIDESRKEGGKILVFMKPCDTFSLVQLLTEHRVNRENVYIVGVNCGNMTDINKLKDKIGQDTLIGVREDGDYVIAQTLLHGDIKISAEEVALERCLTCKSTKHRIYDELLCEEGEDFSDERRFAPVEALERMTDEERYAFWRGELSKCIRCNACRNACPACTCENCVFDNPDSGIQNKAAANSFEENLFHIIRAYHVAGRCTDCGECSRVCPQNIPLHLLNRKYIKDINELYGRYRAGEKEGQTAPMTDYKESDLNPAEAVKGGAE